MFLFRLERFIIYRVFLFLFLEDNNERLVCFSFFSALKTEEETNYSSYINVWSVLFENERKFEKIRNYLKYV